MPHMKYFQPVAGIRDIYREPVRAFNEKSLVSQDTKDFILGQWGFTRQDKRLAEEEIHVLEYIIACQHGVTYHDTNLKKPTREVVNRCFNRHLEFLKDVFEINDTNVNKYPVQDIKKQFKACKYYMFKFSLDGWYQSMPDVILTMDNKYGKS